MSAYVLFCVTVLLINACATVDGSTYAVAMLGLELQSGVSSSTYTVVMVNPGTTAINVAIETKATEGSPSSQNVAAGGSLPFTVIPDNVMNGSEISNKTVLFSSPDDFVLQVFSESNSHTEGLLGIPIESLNGPHQIDNIYEYVVSTFCATSGFCQLAVTSNQMVNVKVTFPGHVNDVVFCIGFRYFRSWRDNLIKLDKFDALQIETTKDLTGTHIYSMGVPIVVYVGSRNITTGGVAKHMLEQLTPASHWGKKFGVTTLGDGSYGDVLKIAATTPNTLVKIKGFPNFMINNRSHVVTRRLDKDMITTIEANYPIQVLQFTGLTYATADPAGSVAMTTVPAVEHGANSTTVTCGASATEGTFFLLTDKTAMAPSVESTPASTSTPIMYWDKSIYNSTSTDTKYTVEGANVFGIVQCGGQSAFPLTTMNTYNDTVTEENVNTEETCIEGEQAWTEFEYGHSPTPAVRDLNGMEVLKIRVQVCGEAVIKLEQATNNTVAIRLTGENTILDMCHGDSCERSELDEDNFNTNLTCGRDMAVYWIKQKSYNESSIQLCFGVGPTHDRTEDCSSTSLATFYFKTSGGSLFDRYSVVGLNSDAFFLMDLEANTGCSVHVSDWRCEDKIQNCSTYGPSICDSADHTQFTSSVCNKYCGRCQVDSYGKKFLIVFPYYYNNANDPNYVCHMTVTTKDPVVSARLSVATKSAVVKSGDFSTNTTFQYDCTQYREDAVIVRSNEEVAVSVFFWINEKVISYTVYPVDAFDTEYMSFTFPAIWTQKTFCKITSENDDVSIVPYFGSFDLKQDDTIDLEDGKAFTIASDYTLITSNGNKLGTSVSFVSDKPIGVFCGNSLYAMNKYPDSFNQLLPTSVWGTLYRTPALAQDIVTRPFNGELYIQAYMANTFISIDGDFNANYSLTSVGQLQPVAINLGSSYTVWSNYPISMGLYLTDATDSTGLYASSHIIPPVTSYGSNTLLAAPMSAISTMFPDFGAVSSLKSYFVPAVGNSTIKSPTSLSDSFYMDFVSEQAFGLTVVIGANSKWFVLPSYSSLVPLNDTVSTCTITTTVPGDGVDNDCDNLADEDVCYSGYGVYGEDLDIDGDFNDDCVSSVKTEPVVEAADAEPVCLIINKTVGQCWTVCECKCSWVAYQEYMENLTTEEFTALQTEKSAAVAEELKIKTDDLSSATAQLGSAVDERQSAANIGYLGIALFTVVFGTIFIMDVSALLRDMKTFGKNFRHGCRRAWRFVTCKAKGRG